MWIIGRERRDRPYGVGQKRRRKARHETKSKKEKGNSLQYGSDIDVRGVYILHPEGMCDVSVYEGQATDVGDNEEDSLGMGRMGRMNDGRRR
jgi:hypothetical protein